MRLQTDAAWMRHPYVRSVTHATGIAPRSGPTRAISLLGVALLTIAGNILIIAIVILAAASVAVAGAIVFGPALLDLF